MIGYIDSAGWLVRIVPTAEGENEPDAVVMSDADVTLARSAVPPVRLQHKDGAWSLVDPRTLAEVKADKRRAMAAAFEAARAAGVTLGTKTAPTDSAAWTRYLAIKAMAGDAGWVDVPIPLADGTFELLTPAKAATLWTALRDMERTLLARLRDRIESINAATTATEVAAVTW